MLAGLAATDRNLRGLRPFDPLRDLRPATELIELAFGEALDEASREMLREMRTLGWLLGPLMWLLNAARLPLSDFFGGYVWMDDGHIVGNVTIHRHYRGYKGWFISNLAVHPDHRRQGIGRRLVSEGVESARREGARRISLEVRADNVPARKLYEDLGFSRVDSVTRMKMDPQSVMKPVSSKGYEIGLASPNDWRELLRLAETSLSPEAKEIMPPRAADYRMSLARRLISNVSELLRGGITYRFVARTRGELAAVLTLRRGGLLLPDSLSLTVHPEHRGQVEEVLLANSLSAIKTHRSRPLLAKIRPSYASVVDLLKEHGFLERETLDLFTLRLECQ